MAYKNYNTVNEEVDKAQSKINAAGLINSTLERLWMDCYNAMANGDLRLWNIKMDAIWNILGGDQLEGDNEDLKMSKLNLAIYNTGGLNHRKIGFQTLEEGERETMALQYLLLNKKSLFLRRLQNSQGKGTAYKSSDDDEID